MYVLKPFSCIKKLERRRRRPSREATPNVGGLAALGHGEDAGVVRRRLERRLVVVVPDLNPLASRQARAQPALALLERQTLGRGDVPEPSLASHVKHRVSEHKKERKAERAEGVARALTTASEAGSCMR